MNLMGQFEREDAALVWRRGTAGCAAAFGGLLTLAFGLAMATLRSEVRVDRDAAVIRRSMGVTLHETRVPVRGCAAVAAVRNLVAVAAAVMASERPPSDAWPMPRGEGRGRRR